MNKFPQTVYKRRSVRGLITVLAIHTDNTSAVIMQSCAN